MLASSLPLAAISVLPSFWEEARDNGSNSASTLKFSGLQPFIRSEPWALPLLQTYSVLPLAWLMELFLHSDFPGLDVNATIILCQISPGWQHLLLFCSLTQWLNSNDMIPSGRTWSWPLLRGFWSCLTYSVSTIFLVKTPWMNTHKFYRIREFTFRPQFSSLFQKFPSKCLEKVRLCRIWNVASEITFSYYLSPFANCIRYFRML